MRLLLGFAGSFHRSELAELAALRVEDLEETEEGLEVQLGRSKSDPEGQGKVVGIVRGQKLGRCPVRALRAWLEASGISEGALFRQVDHHARLLGPLSGRGVTLVVKRSCAGGS